MIMENFLTIGTPSGSMPVFMAAPEGEKLPVIIVIQEIFGVNEHIKNVCRRLAGEGYIALAPELFHRQGTHITVPYSDRDSAQPLLAALTNEDLVSDIRDVISFLRELPQAETSKVFTLGFCAGGFASLLAATKLQITGAISFYGSGVVRPREGIQLRPFAPKLSDVRSPLLMFFGEKDASIPEGDRFEIRRVLDENHIPHELVVFGEADHGFFCDERKSYHAASAKLAWEKMIGWLAQF